MGLRTPPSKKKKTFMAQFFFDGADERIRTADLLFTKHHQHEAIFAKSLILLGLCVSNDSGDSMSFPGKLPGKNDGTEGGKGSQTIRQVWRVLPSSPASRLGEVHGIAHPAADFGRQMARRRR